MILPGLHLASDVLTHLTEWCYGSSMETIMFKAANGTKARLRQINRNISALLREEVERLLDRRSNGSAYEKAEGLCGVIKGGPRNAATSKDYLKQYGQKGSD